MDSMIAPCGNDCSICPKYTAKTSDELQKAAELWYRIGWSDKITSPEKTKCSGCSPSRILCAIIKCHIERQINKCNLCLEFPCEKLNTLIQGNENLKIKCKEICSDSEYKILHKAFFEKETNLRE